MIVWIFWIVASVCVWPAVSSGVALLLGALVALSLGNPQLAQSRRLSKILLQVAIVGLGAGMNLQTVLRAGFHGMGYTAAGIAFALGVGWWLGRCFRTDRDTGFLLSIGTAICGGSAIAAAAAVLRPKPEAISLALAAVFTLNAIALWIFPAIGHALRFSEAQFGLWSALAIHDTSSVVGAAMQYGPQALQIATTVKLARALWILPLTLGIALWQSRRTHQKSAATSSHAPIPWFIAGFIACAALVTAWPGLQPAATVVVAIAKRLLVLALFFIGSTITREALQHVGWRIMAHAVTLWLLVASTSAWCIATRWIG